MIVVMPYGYMNNGTPGPSTPEATGMYQTFSREMTECIMPYVEKNFRTFNDRHHRAIAGFSRGGGQSMFTALTHPDKFGWLGSYSAYLTPQVMDKFFPDLKATSSQLHMLWMCVGTSDFLYKDVIRNQQYFDKKELSISWLHGKEITLGCMPAIV